MSRVRVSKADLWKAIRAKCRDCCCDSRLEIRLCEIRKCPLWKYRFGRPLEFELEQDTPPLQ